MALELIQYTPDWSDECMRLEKSCAQGKKFKMWFDRPKFHQRSMSYDYWEIWLIKDQNRVVASSAWAEKTVSIQGVPEKAAYFYDVRVHPDYRRQGLVKRLNDHVYARLEERKIKNRYFYVVRDNQEVFRLVNGQSWIERSAYSYWVWPVFKKLQVKNLDFEKELLKSSDPNIAHIQALGQKIKWDFYSDSSFGGPLQGYRNSILGPGVSASIWSNQGILEEVIEEVPPLFRFARTLSGTWPIRHFKLPLIPKPGERIKSEFIFDLSFQTMNNARDLIIHANNEALDKGLQYLYYFVPLETKLRLQEIRGLTPKWASPWVDFSLVFESPGRTLPPFQNVYPDIRDI